MATGSITTSLSALPLTEHHPTLLGLPLETREQIYKLVLQDACIYQETRPGYLHLKSAAEVEAIEAADQQRSSRWNGFIYPDGRTALRDWQNLLYGKDSGDPLQVFRHELVATITGDQLLWVNRQVYREARKIFLACATFKMHPIVMYHGFTTGLEEAIHRMHNIEVECRRVEVTKDKISGKPVQIEIVDKRSCTREPQRFDTADELLEFLKTCFDATTTPVRGQTEEMEKLGDVVAGGAMGVPQILQLIMSLYPECDLLVKRQIWLYVEEPGYNHEAEPSGAGFKVVSAHIIQLFHLLTFAGSLL